MSPTENGGAPGKKSYLTWSSPAELEQALAARPSGWIFKHSTRCGVSSAAAEEVEKAATRLPIHRILVIENRATSLAIAEKLGVQHASPQAILLRDGQPVWTATHWAITSEALETAEAENA